MKENIRWILAAVLAVASAGCYRSPDTPNPIPLDSIPTATDQPPTVLPIPSSPTITLEILSSPASFTPPSTVTPLPVPPEATLVSPKPTQPPLEQPTPERIIENSVWPGGISIDLDYFIFDEAQRAAYIFNGTMPNLADEDELAWRLSAARAYAESIFDLEGTIDTTTLTERRGESTTLTIGSRQFERTSDTFFEADWRDGKLRGTARIYEVVAPEEYSYNQIAVYDSNPRTALVANNSPTAGELLYVVEVTANETTSAFTFRGACGNIGREGENLPWPTPGVVEFQVATPTFPLPPPTEAPPITAGPTQPSQPTQTEIRPTAVPTNPHSIPTATAGQPPAREATATDVP